MSSLRVDVHRRRSRAVERAAEFEETTGATVLQFYGSNETGALSRTTTLDTRERRLRTAGRIIDEMEVRMFDPTSPATSCRRGSPASRRARARPRASATGATRRPTPKLFTADGWMLMGDIVDDRRRGLPHGRRAGVGLHHPGRQEHQRPGGRGRDRHAPRRGDGRRGRHARPRVRRTGVRLRGAATGAEVTLASIVAHLVVARRLEGVVPGAPGGVDELPGRPAARSPRATSRRTPSAAPPKRPTTETPLVPSASPQRPPPPIAQ